MITIFILTLTLIITFFRSKKEQFKSDHEDNCSFIHKRAIARDKCNTIVNLAKNMKFDTDAEPVDDKPLYQIDVFVDGEILNRKLWNKCKTIYRAYKEYAGFNDFMFIKRYKMTERIRLEPHRDRAKYTISVLLSDTKDFNGCEFFIFNEKTSKYIYDNDIDPKETKDHIASLGKLPIINFEQGDLIRFNSKCIHGVTNLKGGERYLLTIFYGTF